MHSVPQNHHYISLGKWLACQSMDNQIIIFNVLNRMKMMRKKVFKGHMVCLKLVATLTVIHAHFDSKV